MSDDEKYMPTDGRKSTSEVDVTLFLLAEEVMEALKLLDYEIKFCRPKNFPRIDRSFFCKAHSKPQQQFHYFTNIVSWLMGLNNHYFPPPAQFDDPNTTSASILLELRKMGLVVEAVASKIKMGFGEGVVSVLKSLTDLCMRNVIRLGSISHRPDGYADDITGDSGENENNGDIADEVGDMYGADDEMFREESEKKANLVLDDDLLMSKVDPNAWKIELERVRPLLKLTIQADSRDWRTHLESIVSNQDAISNVMSETNSSLDKFGVDVGKVMEKIQGRENTLNSQFDSLVREFKQTQAKLTQTSEQYKNSSHQITAFSSELTRVTDELESIKRHMEELSTSISDATPVTKIKAALSSIKAEIKSLDLRLGVASNSLIQHRLRDKHARPSHGKKSKLQGLDASFDDM